MASLAPTLPKLEMPSTPQKAGPPAGTPEAVLDMLRGLMNLSHKYNTILPTTTNLAIPVPYPTLPYPTIAKAVRNMPRLILLGLVPRGGKVQKYLYY
eukprot:scaffold133_cov169-Amphora_coffeaeformis.AAC.2